MFSDFAKKMIAARQIEFMDGVFILLDKRGVILPAQVFVKYFLENYKALGNKSLNILYDVGKWHGKENVAGRAVKKFKLTKESLLREYGDSANIMGLGKFEWTEYFPSQKKLIVRLYDSVFAEELEKQKFKIKKPVDSLACGIIAGLAEGTFSIPVKATETKCKYLGASFCEIIAKPKKK